ncbi:MAG: hypothetical protein HFH41_13565 [Lachnospiraceae bacterium]|nr:hypothetical protein [Lachnospiraceae bacterium]
MKKKICHILAIALVFIMTLSTVETTVPTTVQAKSKTTTVNKSITLTTSKTIKTKYTIKSVKSSKSSILSAKKVSSKKFKVTSKYKYGSAVITVKFKNGKTTKYKYNVGKYSLKKGKKTTVSTKYTIKSVKSDKTKIASVKKASSKKFKVTAKKAGTAKITVKFKNGKKAVYYFKVTGSSGGGNNNNNNSNNNNNDNNNDNNNNNSKKVSLNKTSLTMNEGDSATLALSIPSSYTDKPMVFWESSNTSVVTVPYIDYTNINQKEMEQITIKAVGKGSATITVLCTFHTEEVVLTCRVTVNESKKSASVFGFSITAYTSKSTFKNDACFSRNTDGTNTYETFFYCNGSEYWLNRNVTFEVTDVTPAAYAKMYSDMGIKYQAPTLKVDSAASDLREWNAKEGQVNWSPIKIQEPFTNAGPGQSTVTATGGKKLIINAGMGTRAVKLVAKQGDKVLDYIYLTSNSRNKDNPSTYSKYDQDLYRAVLNKVEQALWKPGMTNCEKLSALKDYINTTNHYPKDYITSKEYNSTFWKNWSVDNTYIMTTDKILNDIMIFQGGICDCWAAQNLMTIAINDLGIPKIKDGTVNGEGVWLGFGSNSTNPINPSHMTMFYKDSQGTLYGFDVNGMTYNPSEKEITCEEHKCREKLISLK